MSTEFVWHGHHESKFPVEVLRESFESRLNTIMIVKAKDETAEQIKRRLQLFKKVQSHPEWLIKALAEADKAMAEADKTMAEYRKASAEYDKALVEYDKASAEYYRGLVEYNNSRTEFGKAIRHNLSELMELHKQECGCGWTPENRNIFKYQD